MYLLDVEVGTGIDIVYPVVLVKKKKINVIRKHPFLEGNY